MTASQAPLVVGVVLYRNTPEEIERLLASLALAQRLGGTAFDVIWHDNSDDDSWRRRIAHLPISVPPCQGNLGFGRAHNVLMKAAFSREHVEAYVCLNPDALVHPDMFSELVNQARRMERPGLIEALQFPDEHPKAYDPVTGETDWCSGCALFVTREFFRASGGFDENIFMYCEDVDLSWRARLAGFQTATAPRALVHHFTGARAPGGHTDLQMRRAGAYLAKKWGHSAFRRWCEEEYAESTGERLSLPAVAKPTRAMKAIADFSRVFHFARVRW